jgi:hypothetical protein
MGVDDRWAWTAPPRVENMATVHGGHFQNAGHPNILKPHGHIRRAYPLRSTVPPLYS